MTYTEKAGPLLVKAAYGEAAMTSRQIRSKRTIGAPQE